MVTLRRDVAAARNGAILTREPTDYDIFMEQKRKNEALTLGRYERSSYDNSECLYSDKYSINYFGRPEVAFQEAAKPEPAYTLAYQTYADYLKAQLNRKAPERLLTEEEFSRQGSRASSYAQVAPSAPVQRAERKKLSKSGKIFVAVYVLAVGLIASIILMINAGAPPKTADAEGAYAPSVEAPID
jgi:hypothetical protein